MGIFKSPRPGVELRKVASQKDFRTAHSRDFRSGHHPDHTGRQAAQLPVAFQAAEFQALFSLSFDFIKADGIIIK